MFQSLDLPSIWFILIAVLLTGYAILDGFDLGVGILHLFIAKTDEERRLLINSIGPIWDGNEVWLVTGGGALFAAFPIVYATIFSGFYLALILLLLALIMRAVAIEFRHQEAYGWWHKTWDTSFFIGSLLAALLPGVALGNVAIGVPIDRNLEFAGSFLGLLNPYALLVGITTLALFSLHGSLFLLSKLEGKLRQRTRKYAFWLLGIFCVLDVLLALCTFIFAPHLTTPLTKSPLLYLLPLADLLSIVAMAYFLRSDKPGKAFLASCANIACLMALLAIGMYPNLVFSSLDPLNSLSIFNAASSHGTLGIMLTIALIGMPVVILYSIAVHYVFRGKTRLGKDSY